MTALKVEGGYVKFRSQRLYHSELLLTITTSWHMRNPQRVAVDCNCTTALGVARQAPCATTWICTISWKRGCVFWLNDLWNGQCAAVL